MPADQHIILQQRQKLMFTKWWVTIRCLSAVFNSEIYRILCAFNFLCGVISLMGFDMLWPHEEEKKSF